MIKHHKNISITFYAFIKNLIFYDCLGATHVFKNYRSSLEYGKKPFPHCNVWGEVLALFIS
jgi:hypothetical protein